jgi:methyl-accepting chemotaxis protein
MKKTGGADGMVPMQPIEAGGYEAELYSIFEQTAKAHSEISVVSLGTSDGGFLQYPAIPRKPGYDSRTRDWYKDTVKQPDKVLLTDPFQTSKGVPTIGIFSTVRSQANEIKGVFGFNIDLPIITDMIDNIKIGETGYVILIDSHDTIIAHPRKPEMNFKKIKDLEIEAFNDLESLTSSSAAVTIDGVKQIARVVVSPATGWKYICLVDESEVFSESAKLRKVMLVTAFVTIVLVLVAAFLLSNKIVKPLLIMRAYCDELASGDFRDKPQRLVRNDEIGQLADSLANMRKSVCEAFKKVNASAEQVAAASAEMTESADQSAQAISQVAEAISNVADGAEKQLTAVDKTTAVTQEVSAGIQQAAVNANQAAGNSAQAADKAMAGEMAVEQAVAQMEHTERTVNKSAELVGKLGERSQEIGQIVEAIAGIAGQTNLLALNAAIEAARAGEQGRGFAVVAEEVRKLAEQSQEAAQKISDLISEIQSDTDKAVDSMNEGTREVKIGTESVAAAGQAFKEITTLVAEVSEQVKEISAAMQEMAAGSRQIATSVAEIDGHSKTAAGHAQTVSAATEEQSASMQEVASASQGLARLAEELRIAVSHFKI